MMYAPARGNAVNQPQRMTLQEWRKKRRLTQFQVAVATGISVESISRLERGMLSSLTVEKTLKILELLEIKFDDVIWSKDKTELNVKDGN